MLPRRRYSNHFTAKLLIIASFFVIHWSYRLTWHPSWVSLHGEEIAPPPPLLEPLLASETRSDIPLTLVVTVKCTTSKGPLRIVLDMRNGPPKSIAHFLHMVREGYFSRGGGGDDEETGVSFFRVNRDMTQFGVVEKAYRFETKYEDRDLNPEPDPAKRRPWRRGDFAMIGGTHMVIVRRDGTRMGLNNHDTVAGTIPEADMTAVIDRLYAYNDVIDHPNRGPGPDQRDIYEKGWRYLNAEFPLVDRITGCAVVEER